MQVANMRHGVEYAVRVNVKDSAAIEVIAATVHSITNVRKLEARGLAVGRNRVNVKRVDGDRTVYAVDPEDVLGEVKDYEELQASRRKAREEKAAAEAKQIAECRELADLLRSIPGVKAECVSTFTYGGRVTIDHDDGTIAAIIAWFKDTGL